MDIKPKILFGRVVHKRLSPKVNHFSYRIYNLVLPLGLLTRAIENKYFKLNRRGILSFYNKDHGARDDSDIKAWVLDIFKQEDVKFTPETIALMSLPRVFGYVFNPVSFYFCYSSDCILRAVICEVNNTFGETHSYICCHSDENEIQPDDTLTAKKLFHVSPFIKREGHYTFRFHMDQRKAGVWINLYDEAEKPVLYTSITGKLNHLNEKSCQKAVWRYPLVTFKAILLIHWQAIKLIFKGTRYIHKPLQLSKKLSRNDQG